MADRDVRGRKVGKYELLTQLSVGGMAELFLASMRGPGGFEKHAVIKRILSHAASNKSFVHMFLDEARITAAFNHPNIVHTFDLGEDQDGLWVALEFIAGANLNEVFNACVRKQAVLALGFSASVVHDCALALHYAHTWKKPNGEASPVIHRDVAQKNIMVSWDGQVKLLDFGIAKARGALAHTNVGTVKGTTGYMSPEQIRGDPLDGRSDVFSLGVVLWEMCTGERLYSAKTELEELQLALTGVVRPPIEVEPAVPQALNDVILTALEKDPDKRFKTARDFAKALQQRCGDLLFDQEERATFMNELFSERIAEQRALLSDEVENSGARLRQTIVPTEAPTPAELPARSQKVRTGPAAPSMRDAPKTQPGAVVPRVDEARPAPPRSSKRHDTATDDQLLVAQMQLNALTEGPSKLRRQLTGPLVLGGAALFAVLFLWTFMVKEHAVTENGLHAFPGEPTEEERAATGQGPGVINPLRPIVLPDGTSSANAGTPDVVTPPVDVDPKTKKVPAPPSDPLAKPGMGQLTLALLPEATVFEKGKQVGQGAWVTLTMPAGTHLFTIVGTDGVKRRLSVPTVPGKNKPLRFVVAELPEE